jgi:hypothetical protein
VGLEQGSLSVVSTIEELLERKSSGSGLESENTVVGIHRAYHSAHFSRKKLAQTSPTSSACSVCIVRSLTQATEFSFYIVKVVILEEFFP